MGGGRRERGGSGRPGVGAQGAPPGEVEAQRLLHELEVHQVELQLQNEELRAARGDIEDGLRRYTELFEVSPIGYFVVGGDGAVRDANFAAARLVGIDRERLRGRRLAGFVAERDAETFSQVLAQAALGRERVDGRGCDVVLMHQPAGVVHVKVSATALAGQADAVLVATEDVTGQRLAEQALRDESRRKDELLAALSHELRNPLGPIRYGLSLLGRSQPGSEQAARALGVVERQVAHLTCIVDDLVDVARLVRGKLRLRREAVELGELVRRAVEDHRPTFEAAGVALETGLPREACWVEVDATRVAQVLGNLLGNAVKFTGAGGRVEVSVRREQDAAAIGIRDTGVGIAPEVRDRLFEPFAQAPQPLERSRGGLGLGLATVKGLVELHGGTVSLSSAGPGLGSEFTVRLPRAAAPPSTGREPVPERAYRRRVLVIDDNEDGACTLKEVLELGGHEVRVALDGPSGLALARGFAPEVVICDIGLPGMDGYAVARALRREEATRGVYLVALSGYARPDDLRRAAEAGFDRHLAKPLAIDDLERALAEPRRPRAERRAGADHSPDAGR